MGPLDVFRLGRLDRYLDAVVQGKRPSADDARLDSGLRRAVHALHVNSPAATGFAPSESWERVHSVPHPSIASRRRAAWRGVAQSRPVASAATVALVVLTLLGGYLAMGLVGSAPGSPTAASVSLLISSDVSLEESEITPSRKFTELDPATLADLDDAPGLDLGDGGPQWALSADGTTLVTIEYDAPERGFVTAEHVWIVVRDGSTGTERQRFQPGVVAGNPRLSTDGSRLVVANYQDAPGKEPVWYVLDTADGRILTTVQAAEWWGVDFWIDGDATRLFRLVDSGTVDDPGPRPVILVMNDLTTGREIGRLTLGDVLGGPWKTGEILFNNYPEILDQTPGLAVSPDGDELAIVHADREAVTLVSTDPLEVERTIEFSRPVGAIDRLVSLLPLRPQEAKAKAGFGPVVTATFAPDGRYLYITGVSNERGDEDGESIARGLGLRRIDLETGAIVAEVLPDARIGVVLPTPDGEHLYVYGPKEQEYTVSWTAASDDSAQILRLLDATNLTILAEREYEGYRWVMLRPVS